MIAVCALVAALGVLVTLFIHSDGIVATARQSLNTGPVVYAHQSAYQDIVVTRRGHDRWLYLNGGLRYSTRDEYRYTESLVYPAVGETSGNTLVIGGGDGLAARELLRMGIRVTQVEPDPEMIELARTMLRDDNQGSLDDPRVTVVIDDAFTWLQEGNGAGQFDTVIIDHPDPSNDTMARLYSEEFYATARSALWPRGTHGRPGSRCVEHPGRVLAGQRHTVRRRVPDGASVPCSRAHVR